MQELWREIRTALQQQRELYGDALPLPAGDPSDTLSHHSAAPDDALELKSVNRSPRVLAEVKSTIPAFERVLALIPQDSPLRLIETLEEVAAFVRDTTLIPLDAERTNAVFGVGDPAARLMLIGEAPGADEDRLGEPFVGRAGMLLNKVLESVHFRREEVYITNILKSRPPNNREPLPAEVEAHLPVLYKQIGLIKPKLILCTGKTAGNSLLKARSTLGALRGRFHDFHGIPVLVTYHPAALLRNPEWKHPAWEDMKLLRNRYDKIVSREGA